MKNLKGIIYALTGLTLAILFGNYLFTTPVQAQIKLKYAAFPPPSTYPCVAMERWKTEMEKIAEGKLKIETYPGGTLLGAKNMLDGVIGGVADIGHIHLDYFPGVFPVMDVMHIPLGWPSTTLATACAWGIYEKYAPKELNDFKVIALFPCPPSNIMSIKPIRSPSDLKGYELRTPGSMTKVLELLGGVPIAMPMSEVPEALQKGIVKGQITSLEVLKDFRFAEYTGYATGNLNMTVGVNAAIMNKNKWNSLPENIKNLIDNMAKQHSLWAARYNDDHVKEALEWSKKNYNLQIHYFSKDELTKWFALLKPFSESYVESTEKRGLPGKTLMQDVLQFREKYAKEYTK